MNDPSINVAVVIAGGLGTRMRPTSRAVPKEFLPVFNRPLIERTVGEVAEAGASRIIIVTSERSLPILKRYFSPINSIEHKDQRFHTLYDILKRVSISYVVQPYPLGAGDALLMAETLIEGEPFILALPDVVFTSSNPSLELTNVYETYRTSLVSVTFIGPSRYSTWGIVVEAVDHSTKHRTMRVDSVLEKPGSIYDRAIARGINGRYIFTHEIFEYIREAKRQVDGEIGISDGLELLAKRSNVHYVDHYGKVYDAGNATGILSASVMIALQNVSNPDQLRAYLLSILSGDPIAAPPTEF